MARTARLTLRTLFDFSFTEVLTLELARLLYVLLAVGGGAGAVAFGVTGFTESLPTGLGTLVLAVALYLAGLSTARLWLEALVIFFRMADCASEIAEQAAQIALNTDRTTSGRPEMPVGPP